MKTTVAEAIPELVAALGETAWMVWWSWAVATILGIATGVVLRLTAPDGLRPNRVVYAVLGAIVNMTRSLPFLILMIALIPLTKYIVGTSFGPTAAIVPLAVASTPFFGRIVESNLREVADGKIEAAQVAGASVWQIVWKVLLPEAAAPLVAGATLNLVMLIGYSAMAGTIGGGGVGDFAVRYGYQRNNQPVLLVSVVVLIVIVQAVQSLGDLIVRGMAHKRA